MPASNTCLLSVWPSYDVYTSLDMALSLQSSVKHLEDHWEGPALGGACTGLLLALRDCCSYQCCCVAVPWQSLPTGFRKSCPFQPEFAGSALPVASTAHQHSLFVMLMRYPMHAAEKPFTAACIAQADC